jgi:hypothetical protein
MANLPVLVFDFDDTLINTKREDGNTHPLALVFFFASRKQNTFNPVYDENTKKVFQQTYSMELSTPIGEPIDLSPLLNQHLINKVLIPAARLRDQGKIGAILILSNTTVKKQLTWFDQYMLILTQSVGQFQSLRHQGKANNSKPFNNSQNTGRWQDDRSSRIDWEDKQYFFDYIMERNNRARGDLTLINSSSMGCLGLSCTGSNSGNHLAWTRKRIEHVDYITRKLGIPARKNVFFFDDLSPTIEFHHPVADYLKEKYVHIRSRHPTNGSVRDGYGVFDDYTSGQPNKLSTITPYEDATVYPQALLDILAEASTPANVGLNLRAAANALEPAVGGKRRRITKHKKTLKRRQARSRRRV